MGDLDQLISNYETNRQNDLKKLCEGAEIKNGLSIPGANVYDAQDNVAHWVAE